MRRTLTTATLCALALAPATAAQAKSRPVHLVAPRDTTGTTLSRPQGVTLTTIDPDRFSVRLSPSRGAVSLRYPKLHPCATTTIRLSVVPSADPLQTVRTLRPDAFEEGTVLHPAPGQALLSPEAPATFAAWRQRDAIVDNFQLVTAAVAARQLRVYTKGASIGRDAVKVITISGRTTRTASACAGVSRFTLGPGLGTLAQAVA